MKKQCLIALLLLASCASQNNTPHFVADTAHETTYHTDLSACEDWAKPTKHEWAQRCKAQGDSVMISSLIAGLSGDDPRDHDTKRQNMPNSTSYRLSSCMQAKGYKLSLPSPTTKLAAQ